MSVNMEKLFDLICARNDAQGSSFKFDKKIITPAIYHGVLKRSIQAFMHNVAQSDQNIEGRKIQAFQGSSSLPQLTKDVFNVTMALDEYDLLWQKVYKGIPLKKGQLDWEICDVSSSVIFELIPEGAKVKFEGITGTSATAGIKKYGAGMGVTWETIEGRKLYKFVEQMEATRSALYTLWGNIHYGLIATAGALNQISWQGAATDRIIDRDILTINEGAYQIGLANKDKGYGDTANARFEMYCDPVLKARLKAALRATSSDVTGAGLRGETIEYNVNLNFSFNSNIPSNKALLVLPGHKIQNSVYMRELGLSAKEIESLNELRTYWTAFGAVIGDSDQVYELAFS